MLRRENVLVGPRPLANMNLIYTVITAVKETPKPGITGIGTNSRKTRPESSRKTVLGFKIC